MFSGLLDPGNLHIVREISTDPGPSTANTDVAVFSTCCRPSPHRPEPRFRNGRAHHPDVGEQRRRHRHAAQHRAAAVRRPGSRRRRRQHRCDRVRHHQRHDANTKSAADGDDARHRRPERHATPGGTGLASGDKPGVWTDIGPGGPTFTPGDAESGLRLRVQARFTDLLRAQETITSAPTAAVINVNDAPVNDGAVTLGPVDEDSGALTITQADLLAGALDVDASTSSPPRT